jgi:hypothetical protein
MASPPKCERRELQERLRLYEAALRLISRAQGVPFVYQSLAAQVLTSQRVQEIFTRCCADEEQP